MAPLGRNETVAVNASNLRKNVYRLLDRVLRTGKPIALVRKGQRLKVVRDAPKGGKLARLVPHACIKGDPEELVRRNWSAEWHGGRTL